MYLRESTIIIHHLIEYFSLNLLVKMKEKNFISVHVYAVIFKTNFSKPFVSEVFNTIRNHYTSFYRKFFAESISERILKIGLQSFQYFKRKFSGNT